MTRRLQLLIDIIGQLLFLIAFIYLLIGFTPSTKYFWSNWSFFTLFTLLWQLLHATISTRVFDHPLRSTFLKYAAWSFLWVIVALGILWFIAMILLQANALGTLEGVGSIIYYTYIGSTWISPIAFTILIGWYYYLTVKDIYILFNKTI